MKLTKPCTTQLGIRRHLSNNLQPVQGLPGLWGNTLCVGSAAVDQVGLDWEFPINYGNIRLTPTIATLAPCRRCQTAARR